MPQIIDRTDFACTDVDSSQWPKLSCGGASRLSLTDGSFQLEANRFIAFADNGEIRSFDDNHRVVFNRAGNRLEVHEAGDISFLTGTPTPTERLRIRTDGNLQVTGQLAVSGELGVGATLRIADAATLGLHPGGGLRVTVPNATDQIRLTTADDSPFAQLVLNATTTAVAGDLTVAGLIQGLLAANSVGATQLADNAVATTKLADSAVTTAKLANSAVTTAKLVNGAVTLGKIAAGVIPPAIGVAVSTGLQHGQSIAVPSGFTRAECIFFVAFKYLLVEPNNGRTIYNCTADSQGKVAISPDGYALAVGVALGKKGGW